VPLDRVRLENGVTISFLYNDLVGPIQVWRSSTTRLAALSGAVASHRNGYWPSSPASQPARGPARSPRPEPWPWPGPGHSPYNAGSPSSTAVGPAIHILSAPVWTTANRRMAGSGRQALAATDRFLRFKAEPKGPASRLDRSLRPRSCPQPPVQASSSGSADTTTTGSSGWGGAPLVVVAPGRDPWSPQWSPLVRLRA
jgi:hypothetical protein